MQNLCLLFSLLVLLTSGTALAEESSGSTKDFHNSFDKSAFSFGFDQPGVSGLSTDIIDDTKVPPFFDVVVLRPLGMLTTAFGVVISPASLAISALNSDPLGSMFRTWKTTVVNPGRYTFVDPIGYHPLR